MDAEEAVYIISVAARMVGLHAQTLRKYERVGFLEPSRTDGRLRLYSRDDLRRLWQIKRLVDDRGINLSGVDLALDLTEQLRKLAAEVSRLDDAAAIRSTVGIMVARMLRDLEVPDQEV